MKINFASTSSLNNELAIPHELLLEKPYIASTHNIEVCVWPEFIDKKQSPYGDLFIWAYHIRITNKSNHKICVDSRYWRIIDECGNISEIEGEGVVGEKPIIAIGSSYQYSSGVHLKYPSGIMVGKYKIKNLSNNEVYEIKIPNFSLDIPLETKLVH